MVLTWLREIISLPLKKQTAGDLPFKSIPKESRPLQSVRGLQVLLNTLMKNSNDQEEAVRYHIAVLIRVYLRTFSALPGPLDPIFRSVSLNLSRRHLINSCNLNNQHRGLNDPSGRVVAEYFIVIKLLGPLQGKLDGSFDRDYHAFLVFFLFLFLFLFLFFFQASHPFLCLLRERSWNLQRQEYFGCITFRW